MKSGLYKCSFCNKQFGRKWNAFRHNTVIHHDLAKIELTLESQKLTIQKRFMIKANVDKFKKFDHFLSHKNVEEIQEFEEIFDMLFNDLDPNKIDLKINRILGQLNKPFEDLEKTLIYMDDKTKAVVLTKIFESCMKSYNPVKSMIESGRMFQGNAARNKISHYVSKALNLTNPDSIKHVNQCIISSDIFERLNN